MTVRFARPIRMQPPLWVRGRARFDASEEMIVLEEPEEYSIYDDKGRVFELAGIRDPDDAVAFATKHGLLWHGPSDRDLREPFDDWQREASALSAMQKLYRRIHEALKGRQQAVESLWGAYEPLVRKYFELAAETDDDMLLQAQIFLMAGINEQLRGTEQGILADVLLEGGEPGSFSTIAYPPNLLAAVYHEFHLMVVQRWEMRFCPQCGRSFLPVDTRQQFCTPSCANRARYERRRRKERESADAVDAGTAEP